MKRNVQAGNDDRSRCYEFYFSDVDTLVLVEETEEEVIIRATRNSFSEQRKIAFVHELAEEGFIPYSYRFFSGFGPQWPDIRWILNIQWLISQQPDPKVARNFMFRLLGSAILLWVVLVAVFLLR